MATPVCLLLKSNGGADITDSHTSNVGVTT